MLKLIKPSEMYYKQYKEMMDEWNMEGSRIAATLFIYFLNYYGILYKNNKQTIDNNTLTAS